MNNRTLTVTRRSIDEDILDILDYTPTITEAPDVLDILDAFEAELIRNGDL